MADTTHVVGRCLLNVNKHAEAIVLFVVLVKLSVGVNF